MLWYHKEEQDLWSWNVILLNLSFFIFRLQDDYLFILDRRNPSDLDTYHHPVLVRPSRAEKGLDSLIWNAGFIVSLAVVVLDGMVLLIKLSDDRRSSCWLDEDCLCWVLSWADGPKHHPLDTFWLYFFVLWLRKLESDAYYSSPFHLAYWHVYWAVIIYWALKVIITLTRPI